MRKETLTKALVELQLRFAQQAVILLNEVQEPPEAELALADQLSIS